MNYSLLMSFLLIISLCNGMDGLRHRRQGMARVAPRHISMDAADIHSHRSLGAYLPSCDSLCTRGLVGAVALASQVSSVAAEGSSDGECIGIIVGTIAGVGCVVLLGTASIEICKGCCSDKRIARKDIERGEQDPQSARSSWRSVSAPTILPLQTVPADVPLAVTAESLDHSVASVSNDELESLPSYHSD